MAFFRKKTNNDVPRVNNLDLEMAYQMVYDDLWNSGDPVYQGRFDPLKRDDDFMQGVLYVMNMMALNGHNSNKEAGMEKVKAFTTNTLKSYDKAEIVPRNKLDDIKKEIFLNRLRMTDDKVLNYFADEYEKDLVIVKMSHRKYMGEIASGKREYVKETKKG